MYGRLPPGDAIATADVVVVADAATAAAATVPEVRGRCDAVASEEVFVVAVAAERLL